MIIFITIQKHTLFLNSWFLEQCETACFSLSHSKTKQNNLSLFLCTLNWYFNTLVINEFISPFILSTQDDLIRNEVMFVMRSDCTATHIGATHTFQGGIYCLNPVCTFYGHLRALFLILLYTFFYQHLTIHISPNQNSLNIPVPAWVQVNRTKWDSNWTWPEAWPMFTHQHYKPHGMK